MMAVQGPLAAMSPRASADAPATVTGHEDSFASLVGSGQLFEVPKETSALKEIEARVLEMVDDNGAGAVAPEDIDEMASLPELQAPVAPIPAPIIIPAVVPLDVAAAPLSDASLSADEPKTFAAALPAVVHGEAKDGFVQDAPDLAVPLRDGVGGLDAFNATEAMTERGLSAVVQGKSPGQTVSAGTAASEPGAAAFRPAIVGPSFAPAEGGPAQPVAPKGQSGEPGAVPPKAEPPAAAAGAPPVPPGQQRPETDGKKRLAVGGVRIEQVFARGSAGSARAVETPAAQPVHSEDNLAASAPERLLHDIALDKAAPRPEPVSGAPGPDRAATDAKLATPSTSPVEMRSDQSFSTTLTQAAHASAAEAPPPPRSPLVQAALDRIFPLPAIAGETVVRLNPHGLGIIEVVLQDGRNGALDVALRVQNPLVLEAMRQERDAVAQTFSAAQGAAAGSLSMDLFQSGTGQRGAAPGLPAGRVPAGEAGQEDASEEPQLDRPVLQINRADRVNIVT